MNILYVEKILEFNRPYLFVLILIVSVFLGTFGAYQINKSKFYIGFILLVLSMVILISGAAFSFSKVDKGKVKYYVTVNNKKELDGYRIIKQKGELFIVVNKKGY